jgi:hypothetical protein
MNKFDVFIPIAPKDLFRIKLILKYLRLNVDLINNIHICTPCKIDKISDFDNIIYHTDKDILPYVKPSNWKFRPNWIFQQFLKLFQNVTETEFFLTLDSDTVIVNKLDFFEKDTPIWYYGKDQNESQYHKFNKVMFGLEKKATHTYIGDIGFFKKSVIEDFLKYTKLTPEEIINKSYDVVDVSCHISEFELYGNFLETYHTNLYKVKQLKSLHKGKFQHNPYLSNWDKDEVIKLINEGKNSGCDVVNMHSWCIASHDWNDKHIKFEN